MRRAIQILCFLPENSRMNNSTAEFAKVADFVDDVFSRGISDDESRLFRILNSHRSIGVVKIDEEAGRFENLAGKKP